MNSSQHALVVIGIPHHWVHTSPVSLNDKQLPLFTYHSLDPCVFTVWVFSIWVQNLGVYVTFRLSMSEVSELFLLGVQFSSEELWRAGEPDSCQPPRALASSNNQVKFYYFNETGGGMCMTVHVCFAHLYVYMYERGRHVQLYIGVYSICKSCLIDFVCRQSHTPIKILYLQMVEKWVDGRAWLRKLV